MVQTAIEPSQTYAGCRGCVEYEALLASGVVDHHCELGARVWGRGGDPRLSQSKGFSFPGRGTGCGELCVLGQDHVFPAAYEPPGSSNGPASTRMRISTCTASVGTIRITSAKAKGSFSSGPIDCGGGWISSTGAPAKLTVSWTGTFDGVRSRFNPSAVSGGNASGSFGGLAQLAFSLPPPGPSALCDHRRGLHSATLTGTMTLGTAPPAFGPAKTVVNGGFGEYCAILTTDGVVCWGGNANGELGIGTSTGPDDCQEPCSITPVSVGISATSLASDSDAWCAILTSSAVDCWGGNYTGDLGVGSTNGPQICSAGYPCSTTPRPIGISATSIVGSWSGNFCAILTSGGVDCWGDNSFGSVGIGTTNGPESCDGSPCLTTPMPVGISATSLATDKASYCAILTAGGVDCWGSNSGGDLGIGTTGGPNMCPGRGTNPEPCSTSPVPTGFSATSLAGGHRELLRDPHCRHGRLLGQQLRR